MSEELTKLIKKELGVDPFAVIVVDKNKLEGLGKEGYQPGTVVGHAPGVDPPKVEEEEGIVTRKQIQAFSRYQWVCTTYCGGGWTWALYDTWTGDIVQCTGVPC
jgi:hypothetical protein